MSARLCVRAINCPAINCPRLTVPRLYVRTPLKTAAFYNSSFGCALCNRLGYLFRTCNTHIHTHPFNGPLSGTTQVIQYQKGKTNLDFTEARDSGWQWHQLDLNASLHLAPDRQPCQHPTALMFFTGRMPFLPPNQQRQSTEGIHVTRCEMKPKVFYVNRARLKTFIISQGWYRFRQ